MKNCSMTFMTPLFFTVCLLTLNLFNPFFCKAHTMCMRNQMTPCEKKIDTFLEQKSRHINNDPKLSAHEKDQARLAAYNEAERMIENCWHQARARCERMYERSGH